MVSTSDCHPRGPGFDSRLYPRNFSGSIGSGTGSTQPRGRSGFDTVVVKQCHAVRKHYTQYTEIGRLSSWTCSSMGSYGVSEVSAGAGERVGRMVNGTSLISGVYCRAGSLWGQRLCVNNELAGVGGSSEADRGVS